MMYASSNHTAISFGHAQGRRAVQRMVLASMWNVAMAGPAKLMAWFVERRRVAHTVAALQSLSDRTLADIGISREQIQYVARHGRDADWL